MNQKQNRIRELREQANLKQSELADIVGISQQTLSKLERNGYTTVDPVIEEKIADYFSCSIDYLRGNSDIKNPEKYIEEALLLKTEFQKLGIIGKDEDLSDELLSYFRDLLNANKPFLKRIKELRETNLPDDKE